MEELERKEERKEEEQKEEGQEGGKLEEGQTLLNPEELTARREKQKLKLNNLELAMKEISLQSLESQLNQLAIYQQEVAKIIARDRGVDLFGLVTAFTTYKSAIDNLIKHSESGHLQSISSNGNTVTYAIRSSLEKSLNAAQSYFIAKLNQAKGLKSTKKQLAFIAISGNKKFKY